MRCVFSGFPVFVKLNPGHTSAYFLQMMFLFFLNGTEMFPGMKCKQANAVAGTKKLGILLVL